MRCNVEPDLRDSDGARHLNPLHSLAFSLTSRFLQASEKSSRPRKARIFLSEGKAIEEGVGFADESGERKRQLQVISCNCLFCIRRKRRNLYSALITHHSIYSSISNSSFKKFPWSSSRKASQRPLLVSMTTGPPQ